MRIDVMKTKALVIDYQERILPGMYMREELMSNSIKLIEGLHILDVPMLLTTQYEKGLGGIALEILGAAHTDESMDKTSFSCYGDEEIRKEIDTDRTNILICGIEAHICVLQTAIDLKTAGYRPILVENCISSRKDTDKKVAMRRALSEGITITTYESILFELLEFAGTEKFKKISKLIK